MIDFKLSTEQTQLRKGIVEFASKALNSDIVSRDRESKFPKDLWQQCAEFGLQGLPVDKEYGGSGLNALDTVIALEALGYGCEDGGLTFSICAHLLACVVPVWKYGTEAQKQEYLPQLLSGKVIAVNGITESDSGSDVFQMQTKATKKNDKFILSGTKTFCSNAPVADIALAYALTDSEKGAHGGITAFMVPKGAGSTGFQNGQQFEKMGLRTCPIGELIFNDVKVPETSIIGGLGGGSLTFNYSMTWERIGMSATHIGIIERILEQVIEYSRSRKSAGKSINKYQAVSHKIADIKINLEAARLLCYKAAWKLKEGKSAFIDASICKVFVSENLLKSALDVLQIFAGNGYMVDYGIERMLRDSIGSTIYSGTSAIHRNMISAWIS